MVDKPVSLESQIAAVRTLIDRALPEARSLKPEARRLLEEQARAALRSLETLRAAR